MAKDPAFLFYPGDWQLGTMHLTLLQKGCYIELLILQFAKGKFTEAQAEHMLNGSFNLAWPTIREKFETDGTFFWNKRLQIEKDKRKRFTDSRKSNGSVKKSVEHMPKHMEDENENINVTVLKGVQGETWESTKKKWYGDFRWKEKVCVDKKISMVDLQKKMIEFIAGIELKEDYKNIPALKSHFINWYNKNTSNGKSTTGTIGKTIEFDRP